MLERSTTETIGCFATNQIGIASSASTKKITSIVLISLVPYLKLRRKKILKLHLPKNIKNLLNKTKVILEHMEIE